MPAPLNRFVLTGQLADVSAASALYFPAPFDGYIEKVETVLGGAITGADSIITVSVSGTALSPTITVANASSAEGDQDSANYNAFVRKDQYIKVATGGQSSDTQVLAVAITLRR